MTEILTHIQQIIERSRHHDEGFLVDSKAAANRIMEMLRREGLLVEEEFKLEAA